MTRPHEKSQRERERERERERREREGVRRKAPWTTDLVLYKVKRNSLFPPHTHKNGPFAFTISTTLIFPQTFPKLGFGFSKYPKIISGSPSAPLRSPQIHIKSGLDEEEEEERERERERQSSGAASRERRERDERETREKREERDDDERRLLTSLWRVHESLGGRLCKPQRQLQ